MLLEQAGTCCGSHFDTIGAAELSEIAGPSITPDHHTRVLSPPKCSVVLSTNHDQDHPTPTPANWQSPAVTGSLLQTYLWYWSSRSCQPSGNRVTTLKVTGDQTEEAIALAARYVQSSLVLFETPAVSLLCMIETDISVNLQEGSRQKHLKM